MENFNPKEYRDNLAKDLKDTRKTDPEKAQENLEEAQQTEEYQEAKRTHHENRENKEKLGELEYHPIFRGNALYNEMFPDIEPLFKAGEEPDAKLILNEILKHKDKQIILDNTTQSALYKLTEEDIAQLIPSAEIKKHQNGNIDVMGSIKPSIENVNFNKSIDNKISEVEFREFFSLEDAKEIVSLIKNQVPDVNRVIIALSNIADHILSGSDDYRLEETFPEKFKEKKQEWERMVSDEKTQNLLKEIDSILEDTNAVKYSSSSNAKSRLLEHLLEKKEISLPSGITHYSKSGDENLNSLNTFITNLPKEAQDEIAIQLNEEIKLDIHIAKENILIPAVILSQEIEKNLGIKPEYISDNIDISTIDENTAIVFDRHNALSNKMKLEEKIPQQTILMPLDTGIYHAQKIGALKSVDGDFALSKRRLFEKK